jgi:hypothetical protein
MAGKLDTEGHVYLLGPLGPLLLVELMPFLKMNLADIDYLGLPVTVQILHRVFRPEVIAGVKVT